MTFKDVYQQPFWVDDYGMYMFSGKDASVTALDCLDDPDGNVLRGICCVLNSETVKSSILPTRLEKNIITLQGGITLEVRGWGYLTGVLKLSPQKAAKIQDDFAQWVFNRLKGGEG